MTTAADLSSDCSSAAPDAEGAVESCVVTLSRNLSSPPLGVLASLCCNKGSSIQEHCVAYSSAT